MPDFGIETPYRQSRNNYIFSPSDWSPVSAVDFKRQRLVRFEIHIDRSVKARIHLAIRKRIEKPLNPDCDVSGLRIYDDRILAIRLGHTKGRNTTANRIIQISHGL